MSEVDSSVLSTPNLTFSFNNTTVVNKTHTMNTDLMTIEEYKHKKFQNMSAIIHLQEFSISIMKDINDSAQRIEVANLCMIDTILLMDYRKHHSNLSIYIGDLQLDNQMFEHGGFDFPVVLISQKPFVKKDPAIYLSSSLKKNIKNIIENSLLTVDLLWENGHDKKGKNSNVIFTVFKSKIPQNYFPQLQCAKKS